MKKISSNNSLLTIMSKIGILKNMPWERVVKIEEFETIEEIEKKRAVLRNLDNELQNLGENATYTDKESIIQKYVHLIDKNAYVLFLSAYVNERFEKVKSIFDALDKSPIFLDYVVEKKFDDLRNLGKVILNQNSQLSEELFQLTIDEICNERSTQINIVYIMRKVIPRVILKEVDLQYKEQFINGLDEYDEYALKRLNSYLEKIDAAILYNGQVTIACEIPIMIERYKTLINEKNFLTLLNFAEITDIVEAIKYPLLKYDILKDIKQNREEIIKKDCSKEDLLNDFCNYIDFDKLLVILLKKVYNTLKFVKKQYSKERLQVFLVFCNEISKLIYNPEIKFYISGEKQLFDFQKWLKGIEKEIEQLEKKESNKTEIKSEKEYKNTDEKTLVELFLNPNSRREFYKYKKSFMMEHIQGKTMEERRDVASKILEVNADLIVDFEKVFELYQMGLIPFEELEELGYEQNIKEKIKSLSLKTSDLKSFFPCETRAEKCKFIQELIDLKLKDRKKILFIFSILPEEEQEEFVAALIGITCEIKDLDFLAKFIESDITKFKMRNFPLFNDDTMRKIYNRHIDFLRTQQGNKRKIMWKKDKPGDIFFLANTIDKEYSMELLDDGNVIFYFPNKGEYLIRQIFEKDSALPNYNGDSLIIEEATFYEIRERIINSSQLNLSEVKKLKNSKIVQFDDEKDFVDHFFKKMEVNERISRIINNMYKVQGR